MGQLLWKGQLYLRYFVLLSTLVYVRHIPSYEAVIFTPQVNVGHLCLGYHCAGSI